VAASSPNSCLGGVNYSACDRASGTNAVLTIRQDAGLAMLPTSSIVVVVTRESGLDADLPPSVPSPFVAFGVA